MSRRSYDAREREGLQRTVVLVLLLTVSVSISPAVAQPRTGVTDAGETAHRTPWGDPDLQGI